MAWETCGWCPERFNGYRRQVEHELYAHPKERRLRDITTQVEAAQDSVMRAKAHLNNFQQFQAFLAADQGHTEVRLLVESTLQSWPYQSGLERLQEEVAWNTKRVVANQAFLDAFITEHPDMAATEVTA